MPFCYHLNNTFNEQQAADQIESALTQHVAAKDAELADLRATTVARSRIDAMERELAEAAEKLSAVQQSAGDELRRQESENTQLRDKLKVAATALGTYGFHKSKCAIPMGECNCGLKEYIALLTAETKA
jgi:hypothetical protein